MTSKKDPRGTDEYGACRCCDRWFVDRPTDRTTEARHERDGYCAGCCKAAGRAGTLIPPCRHENPGSSYRCPFTTEENVIHLERFLYRIHGASERVRPWSPARAS